MNIREHELKEINLRNNFDLTKNEYLMSVIFISKDEKIHKSFICSSKDIFNISFYLYLYTKIF